MNKSASRKYVALKYVAPTILSSVVFSALLIGQQTATAPYTAAQAEAGRAAYQANCAGCHAADLSGRNDASQLAGSLFMGSWGNRTTRDLLAFMQGSMPPGNPGGLSEATYLNIAAFILDSNGARPGAEPLTVASAVGSANSHRTAASAGSPRWPRPPRRTRRSRRWPVRRTRRSSGPSHSQRSHSSG